MRYVDHNMGLFPSKIGHNSHKVQTLQSVLVHQDFLWMECHAVLFHVPFAKQGELVVVFLLAFALHGLPDSHHLCHQKLHHRCFVQNLEHYLVCSMKRSQPTRHSRLKTIQLRFRTFPRCLSLLRPQNHSRSFLELPGVQIFASSLTFFPILPNSPHTFSQHDKNNLVESYRRSYGKKPRMHIW